MQWERNFREQMKRRREATGESQSSLAKRIAAAGLPFHQPTVQRIESGDRPVRLDEAHVIAQAFGVTLDMMTQSSDDERVDASVAKGHLDRYVRGIDELISPGWQDKDDLAEFVEQLTTIVDAAGGTQTPAAAWLAAWGLHGLAVVEAAIALERAARRFHRDWEPDWEEDLPSYYGQDGYPIDNLRDALESARWEEAPASRRPAELAKLPVTELDNLFFTGSGPFADDAQAGEILLPGFNIEPGAPKD